MMVPRSFRYSAAPPMDTWDEKGTKKKTRPLPWNGRERQQVTSTPRPISPSRTTSEPVRTPTQPVPVPTTEREHASKSQDMPKPNRTPVAIRRKSSNHDPNALPPAVAALLAVTEIPRPKRNQFQRRRSAQPRRISLDELVNEWKNDGSLISSYGSSPGLSILLEDPDGSEEPCPTPAESVPEDSFFEYKRSFSAESVPSLEADDRSILSTESVSTPGSLRSRRSVQNLKKEKVSRSLPTAEECHSDHPLVPSNENPDDDLILSMSSAKKPPAPKTKTSFTSNLTSSLQALKNAAISSISSFTSNAPAQQADDALWSHPYLFPRLSPEVRPAITGKPTKAQRRYLNPPRLTFDDLAAPYQLALHAPFLAEETKNGPSIPLQQKASKSQKLLKRNPNPNSELGRALLASAGVRQREVRENTDFLRMMACELNMKRSGKLTYARAKIFRPPRKTNPFENAEDQGEEKVPKRWVGESAY